MNSWLAEATVSVMIATTFLNAPGMVVIAVAVTKRKESVRTAAVRTPTTLVMIKVNVVKLS